MSSDRSPDVPPAELVGALDVAFDGFALLGAVGESGRVVDFVVTYVNEVGAKLTGRDVRDLVGSRVTELAHRPAAVALLQRLVGVAETGAPYLDEVGELSHGAVWEVKASRVAPDVVAVAYRDVTERVRQE